MDSCPNGYKAIFDVETCIKASNDLGLVYSAETSIGRPDSVCNWCGGCNPKTTKVTDTHGALAKWVCQKGNALFENKFLDTLCETIILHISTTILKFTCYYFRGL